MMSHYKVLRLVAIRGLSDSRRTATAAASQQLCWAITTPAQRPLDAIISELVALSSHRGRHAGFDFDVILGYYTRCLLPFGSSQSR